MKLILVILLVIVFYANNCESFVRNKYSQWPSINHQAHTPSYYTTQKPKTTSKVKKANYVDPDSRISINRQQPYYAYVHRDESSEEKSPSLSTTQKPKTTVKKANFEDQYIRIPINRQGQGGNVFNIEDMHPKIIKLKYISESQIIAMLEELLRIRNKRVGPNKPWRFVLRK